MNVTLQLRPLKYSISFTIRELFADVTFRRLRKGLFHSSLSFSRAENHASDFCSRHPSLSDRATTLIWVGRGEKGEIYRESLVRRARGHREISRLKMAARGFTRAVNETRVHKPSTSTRTGNINYNYAKIMIPSSFFVSSVLHRRPCADRYLV